MIYFFFILIYVPLTYQVNILYKSNQNSVKVDVYCYLTKSCQEVCPLHLPQNRRPSLNNHNNEVMAVNGLYRPRSALARAFYEKQLNDRQLEEFDQTEWYRIDTSRISEELQKKFVQLHCDEETKEFLSSSIDKSSWVWTQIWYLLAKAVLKHFWSITDINGWLGRGSMFVLSEAQARRLLGAAGTQLGSGALVDLGAGDGEVSRRFAHLFSAKFATEISSTMRKTLSSKGYTLLDAEEWWRGEFSCVCALNVLDRCERPRAMLRRARAALPPHGRLLLALVLPYKPYVEVTPDHKPLERLPIQGTTFEEQVTSFVSFMREMGFELAAWSRAPYLCEGDFVQAYYWLDDSVYVFTPIQEAT